MKVLIIEDEANNAKRLQKLLNNVDAKIKVLDVIESVEDAVEYLANNPNPDLVFMDIQLSDGLCFEIFDSVSFESPIIFTTAYDEYAIKAFRLNSIDYLLKPIDEKELKNSIAKYEKLHTKQMAIPDNIQALLNQMNENKKNHKSRFLLKVGKAYKTVNVEDISYFAIDNQLLFVHTVTNNRYPIDNTLDEIEKMIDPALFFRINRQFMVSLKCIKAIHTYFNSRLKLELDPHFDNAEAVIVSREKVKDFKKWLDD
jgi:two-component system response regulator LytT